MHHESLKSSGSWFGKFEKYIIELSRDFLPHVVSDEQIDVFLSAPSLDEQRRLFDQLLTDKLKEIYWYVCPVMSFFHVRAIIMNYED